VHTSSSSIAFFLLYLLLVVICVLDAQKSSNLIISTRKAHHDQIPSRKPLVPLETLGLYRCAELYLCGTLWRTSVVYAFVNIFNCFFSTVLTTRCDLCTGCSEIKQSYYKHEKTTTKSRQENLLCLSKRWAFIVVLNCIAVEPIWRTRLV
jgi:hypothetical protein